MLSKGGEFKTVYLLVEKPNEPVLWCAGKSWPSALLPQVRLRHINERRGEAATDGHLQQLLLWLQTHPQHFHLSSNKLCETVFLNHRQVREPCPKSDLEEDLHLVSKIPLRPSNTPTMMCLCHREIRIFQLKASNTLLVEEQSGKKAYGIRLQQCIFFMSAFHTTT